MIEAQEFLNTYFWGEGSEHAGPMFRTPFHWELQDIRERYSVGPKC